MSRVEVNFDGLVGPTHNYAGLSFGNLASTRNRDAHSNPRAAALEGLEKMHRLMTLGIPQAVLPPLIRPDINALRRLGFSGTEQQILDSAWHTAPDLFTACCSASSMWTANAATVAPSSDTQTGKLVFTPANLLANFHRSIEAQDTTALLRTLFRDQQHFQVNDPLPAYAGFSDEGAANHMRLCADAETAGLHIFAYGTATDTRLHQGRKFPARQTLAASQAVARLNQLDAAGVLYVQQHPDAIDAGVFHNDVIAVAHEKALFCHERAFVDQAQFLQKVHARFAAGDLQVIEVSEADVPMAIAVSSYLFNSQIVTLPNGDYCLILPAECEDNAIVKHYVQTLVQSHPLVKQFCFVDVRQSMRNGGGPACLRLRVSMTAAEIAALQGRGLLTKARYKALKKLVQTHYPEQLALEDLRDWNFAKQLQDVALMVQQAVLL